jgi:hypothetical protein
LRRCGSRGRGRRLNPSWLIVGCIGIPRSDHRCDRLVGSRPTSSRGSRIRGGWNCR